MHPINHRRLTIRIYNYLHSLRKTAVLAQVSHTSVARWLKDIGRKPYQYKQPTNFKGDVMVDIIRITIQSDPFVSIQKLQMLIRDALNIEVSRELVRIAIKRMGLTKKKARFFGQSHDLPAKTEAFINKRAEYMAAGNHIVSIDETGFGRHGPVVKGYAPKGQPLRIRKSMVTFNPSVSVVACVSKDGLVAKEHKRGAFNIDRFLNFLTSLELPTGTVVLLDNVRFHHAIKIKDFAASKGIYLLYVPPYSPWFNPIELCFSIVKRHFYKYGNIEEAFQALTPAHCDAFFRNSLRAVAG